jgi:hypothetical protein
VAAALLLLALAQPPGRYALDADRLQFQGIDDDAPIRGEAENPLEFRAYNEVLLHARQFPAAELAAAADRDVTFRDLVLPVRQDFRLKLVRLDGRLLKLRKYEANKPLRDAGVSHLYEGWLYPDAGDAPLCFLATDPPPGLEPSKLYTPAVPVTAAGFVFKLMRYESAEPHPADRDRRQVRKAPLLMGRSLILRPKPPEPADPWATGFVPGFGVVVGGLLAVGFGMTAWYRRGDRPIKQTLSERRQRNPFAEDSPP